MRNPRPVLSDKVQGSRPGISLEAVILKSDGHIVLLVDGIGAAPALFLVAGDGTVDFVGHGG